MSVYTVVSPHADEYQQTQAIILAFQRDLLLCIKEYGGNGNHEHLNMIYETTQRTQDVNRKIKNLYKKEFKKEPSNNFVRSSKITNVNALIGNYLMKEENHEVLFNKCYDLEAIRTEALKNQDYRKQRFQWTYIPTFMEFPLFYEKYCINNILDPLKYQTNLKHMVRENRIAVHHLLHKKDALWFAIAELLKLGNVQSDEINFYTNI